MYVLVGTTNEDIRGVLLKHDYNMGVLNKDLASMYISRNDRIQFKTIEEAIEGISSLFKQWDRTNRFECIVEILESVNGVIIDNPVLTFDLSTDDVTERITGMKWPSSNGIECLKTALKKNNWPVPASLVQQREQAIKNLRKYRSGKYVDWTKHSCFGNNDEEDI